MTRWLTADVRALARSRAPASPARWLVRPAFSVACGVVLAALPTEVKAAEGKAVTIDRYGADEREVSSLTSRRPEVAAKLAEGEALLASTPSLGDIEKAARLFQTAAEEEPGSALVLRRLCQTLSALGRHAEAVAACEKSLERDYRSVFGMRAAIGALMSGPNPPTSRELAQALIHANRAHEVLGGEPAGYAGRCDIAAKLGDIDMLNSCIQDLALIAPHHYETERARGLSMSVRPGLGTAAGWLALIALCTATLAHALTRRHSRRGSRLASRVSPLASLAVVLGLSLTHSSAARADESARQAAAPEASPSATEEPKIPVAGHLSKFLINEDDPTSSVPTPAERDKDPLEYGYFIMDLGDRGEWAIRKGDHLAAAKYYRALSKAVPDRSVGFVKACEQYEQGGDVEHAIEFCAAAITVPGTVLGDYSHYARLALARPEIRPTDVTNLDHVVNHLKGAEETRSVGLDIECTLGARLSDRARLEDCVPALTALNSTSPKTLFFQWALAMQKKDVGAAEQILGRAKALAGPPQQLKQMERATLEAMSPFRKVLRVLRDWRVGAAFSLVVFAGLCVALLRRRPLSRANG